MTNLQSNSMTGGFTNKRKRSVAGIESLPVDLIIKIFLNLPAKSIGKLRCVSKLWASTLGQSYFTDLFLINSSARPRLLFSLCPFNQGGPHKWCCVSSPQPQNPDENSSVTVDYLIGLRSHCVVSGLILCPRRDQMSSDNILALQIGNPTTGQYVELPILERKTRSSWETRSSSWEFFGFDPIRKQYKILSISEGLGGLSEQHHLLTFPCQKNETWRSIQCPTPHRPYFSGICIDGILYYTGRKQDRSYAIVCFNIRSEEFKFIDAPESRLRGTKLHRLCACLSNLNGKLVLICYPDTAYFECTKLELCVWVLEDEKKPVWSTKHVYCLSLITLPSDFLGRVVGMIGTGEIVLSNYFVESDPCYVFYVNPEKNTIKKVEIQGLEAYKDHTVNIFLDHIENVSFIA